MSGLEDVIIAGGTDMMSQYGVNRVKASRRSSTPATCTCATMHPQPHQGVCADVIATLENIPREALDELALESQQPADTAIKEGRFDRSLIPVKRDDGSIALDREEFPRPQTTLESLSALAPSFAGMDDVPLDEEGTTFKRLIQQRRPGLQVNHVHHAGNSSGVVDGAAALLWPAPRLRQGAWPGSRGPASSRWPTSAMTPPSCSTLRSRRPARRSPRPA